MLPFRPWSIRFAVLVLHENYPEIMQSKKSLERKNAFAQSIPQLGSCPNYLDEKGEQISPRWITESLRNKLWGERSDFPLSKAPTTV